MEYMMSNNFAGRRTYSNTLDCTYVTNLELRYLKLFNIIRPQ
jgi:hypothetical protein